MAAVDISPRGSRWMGGSYFHQEEDLPTAIKVAQQLEKIGIRRNPMRQEYNLSRAQVRAEEVANGEGRILASGALAVDTGIFTGRSPLDKFFVKPSPDDTGIDWGTINQPTSPQVFSKLTNNLATHFSNYSGKLYVFDGLLGAQSTSELRVRVVSESAYHLHFCMNMLRCVNRPIDPSTWNPDVTMLVAPSCYNHDYAEMQLHSETFIVGSFDKKTILIGGTNYSGEIKKGFFSWMNYLLPKRGTLTMHCSATRAVDDPNDVVLFLGLSGTGKTTLSADPKRLLIGDDEHGWDEEGVFNIEGGCYAKVLNLDCEAESTIFNAIGSDAILENVVVSQNGDVDYTDSSKTQNTRCSYPLERIASHEPSGKGGHPHAIVFLTCDVYGVLPPVSLLTVEQAMFHFVSGYTSKVAGTERGVHAPQATFSPCFGAAFMPLPPQYYADLLQARIAKHNVSVYLVNTGWTHGSHSCGGHRISISASRAIVDAIVGKTLDSFEAPDPIFGLRIPTSVEGVDQDVLDPKLCWEKQELYTEKAEFVNSLFKSHWASLKT